jgi:hypothetical protein
MDYRHVRSRTHHQFLRRALVWRDGVLVFFYQSHHGAYAYTSGLFIVQ